MRRTMPSGSASRRPATKPPNCCSSAAATGTPEPRRTAPSRNPRRHSAPATARCCRPTLRLLPPSRSCYRRLVTFDDFGAERNRSWRQHRAVAGAEWRRGFRDGAVRRGLGCPGCGGARAAVGGFVAGCATQIPTASCGASRSASSTARKYASLRRAAVRLAERLSGDGLRIVVDEP